MFVLVGVVSSAFVFGLSWRVSQEFQVIGIILLLVVEGSYLLTAVASPGVGETDKHEAGADDSLLYSLYCQNCASYQPPATVHCIHCDICILNRDHHCPWVGKCIGRDNSVFFSLFLSSLLGLIGYILLCSVLAKPK